MWKILGVLMMAGVVAASTDPMLVLAMLSPPNPAAIAFHTE